TRVADAAMNEAPHGDGMFGRAVFLTVAVVALALLGSFSLLDRLPASAPASVAHAPAEVATDAPAQEAPERQSSGHPEAMLRADGRGQYAADALIDGQPVRMLVDTGASEVVVSASTAARLGLVPSGGRRRWIQTANGGSTATPTILRSVSLGGLYMNDVQALI